MLALRISVSRSFSQITRIDKKAVLLVLPNSPYSESAFNVDDDTSTDLTFEQLGRRWDDCVKCNFCTDFLQ